MSSIEYHSSCFSAQQRLRTVDATGTSNDNFAESLIFGQQELDPCIDDELLDLFEDEEPSPDEAKDETMLEPYDALHWETGTELNESPQDKKEHMATKIKDGYKHPFTTPVYAMLTLMP
jgi:hypothetical protein